MLYSPQVDFFRPFIIQFLGAGPGWQSFRWKANPFCYLHQQLIVGETHSSTFLQISSSKHSLNGLSDRESLEVHWHIFIEREISLYPLEVIPFHF